MSIPPRTGTTEAAESSGNSIGATEPIGGLGFRDGVPSASLVAGPTHPYPSMHPDQGQAHCLVQMGWHQGG